MTTWETLTVLAVPILFAVGLVGCGSDSSPPSASNSTREVVVSTPISTTTRPTTSTTTRPAMSTSATTTTVFLGPSTTQPAADPGTVATDPELGVQAHWSVDPAFSVADTDTTVHLFVRPLECAGDTERIPLRPGVRVVAGEIRITIDLTPLPKTDMGNASCTDPILPVVVDLGMPIDGRPLVDATCLLGGNRYAPNPHDLCVQRP